ncbi:transporter substrate-binding domain-containing protein [Bradyrhizobium tunisiense]|uniref:transporter substrate-binding domain-containing protein n=1 Tax=Bradyrhizobium tunisiense TaxID=3278709 RepID=UPI0035E29065
MSLKIAVRLVMSGVALAASLATGTACAQDAQKVINGATITSYPPFEFKDPKSNELTGFDHDLFEAMAKKVGAKVKWHEFSFADLTSFSPLKTGRVDIYASGGMLDTPERREHGVSFIDYVYDSFVFFTLSANADQFKTPDALCGKRVAISRVQVMASLNKWSEENCTSAGKPALVWVVNENLPAMELSLKQGRADASVNGAGSLANSNKERANIYMTIGKPLSKNIYGMAFLNENKDLGEALKKALDELIVDGTYAQLLQKWGMAVELSSIGQTSSINAGWSLSK